MGRLTGIRCAIALIALSALPDGSVAQQLRPWHIVSGLGDPGAEGLDSLDVRSLARAEFALGNHAQALAIASDGESRLEPEDPLVLAIRAEAALENGEFREAAVWFAAGAEVATGLDRVALLARAGEAYRLNGWNVAALEYFGLAAAADPAAAAWMKLASAMVASDDDFEAMLAAAPEASAFWQLRVRAGRLVEGDEWRDAIPLLERTGLGDSALALAIARGDSTVATEVAIRLLSSSGVAGKTAAYSFLDPVLDTFDEEVRINFAEAAMTLGHNARAATVMSGVTRSDSSALALRLLGRALERSGRRSEALTAYAAAATGVGPDATFARYARGQLLMRMRRYGPAIEALRAFAADNPDHRFVRPALLSVSRRLTAAGDLAAAESTVAVLDRDWQRYADASTARMLLADAATSAGDFETALTWYMAEIAARGAESTRARYDVALIRREQGESVRADSTLRVLARVDLLGYYGMKARDELGLGFPALDSSDVALTPSARVELALRELDFLRRAGLDDFAGSQIDYIVGLDSMTGDEALTLARGFIERDLIPQAVRMGWRAAGELGVGDRRVVQAIFPWPYRQLIDTEAAEWGVDPYLVAAIIRQESAFDAGATSRAGARGLMQLMPPTARWRARQFGGHWRDRYLAVPDANLHVGIGHLADLLERSDDIVYTLASYNAGGGNVRRWRRRSGMNRPETFIERIPFPETRGYVKAVLRNRYLYRALYPGE